ncbi:unnamed protein product [Phytophthora fragariaefolia]|uniref:Unnamed protein product n=1 Tax=Phytophthora fragariaefolia TaxID=1490495 RepID=A0A9W6XE56_9STRA|nr:unnamed protein product [Phytophthora fragariaefolia]
MPQSGGHFRTSFCKISKTGHCAPFDRERVNVAGGRSGVDAGAIGGARGRSARGCGGARGRGGGRGRGRGCAPVLGGYRHGRGRGDMGVWGQNEDSDNSDQPSDSSIPAFQSSQPVSFDESQVSLRGGFYLYSTPPDAMTAQGPAKTADSAPTEDGPPPTPPARADVPAPDTTTTADVVDVTSDSAAWTETPARSTTEPPPIRASKRVAKRKVAPVDAETAKKGKKKLVRGAGLPASQAAVATTTEESSPPITIERSRARRGAKRGFRPEKSKTAGHQVATQSTAPMMVIRPRATRTALQPAAPEMAIPPRSATVPEMAIQPMTSPEMAIQPRNPPEMAIQPRTLPEMAIQPRTTSAPEMVIQPRAVETDSGPEDTQACTDFGARATRTTHNVITSARSARVTENAVRRATGFEALRRLSLNKALGKVGLQLPTTSYPASRQSSSGTEFLLNTRLQRTLSEFVRRTHMPLPALVELVRGQTETDYRPNKHIVPTVIAQVCKDYQHLEKLQGIAAEGVRVELKKDVPLQAHPPDNHGSAIERVNILRKNVRKEQDAWGCLTIHDLSFPEGASINDVTDQDAIPKADYRHRDAVDSEILQIKRKHPDIEIKAMAGDVTLAFRNIPIHSRSVHHFAGRIEIENALLVELACPFGWTGSPGNYKPSEGR